MNNVNNMLLWNNTSRLIKEKIYILIVILTIVNIDLIGKAQLEKIEILITLIFITNYSDFTNNEF